MCHQMNKFVCQEATLINVNYVSLLEWHNITVKSWFVEEIKIVLTAMRSAQFYPSESA